MALARVVTFEGVSDDRIEEMRSDLAEEDPREDIPATEILVLHDAAANESMVVVLFENEEDYRRADETLSAMPADETPGARTAVNKYEVAIRRTF